jgi:hypothetical protein
MPPRPDTIRLGPLQEAAVYVSTALLVISGAVWLVLHYFMAQNGQFGPMPHPLEPWMLRIHGAVAMAGLIVYGSLLPIHIRRAWAVRRNIVLGIVVAACMLALTITGYLLYYAGNEAMRPIISAAHWLPGLAAPLLLLWHVLSGRRTTAQSMRA